MSVKGRTRRRGFGLDLIEHGLPYELDAETRLVFGPNGLGCTIELPLDDAPAARDSALIRDHVV